MKRAILTTMLFLACLSAQASADTNPQPKVSSSKSPFGGTIGPIVKFGQLGTGVMTTLGGRVNATLFNMFLLGLGGHCAVAQSKLEIAGTAEEISYYYGALGVGVRFFPSSFIHLTSYNSFGLGNLNLKNRAEKGLAYSIEPELNLEVDLFSLFRVGAGASYRFMFSDSIKVPSSALSGFGGQVFVEFGWL